MKNLKAVYEMESNFRVVSVEDGSVERDRPATKTIDSICNDAESELTGETWTAVVRQEQQG